MDDLSKLAADHNMTVSEFIRASVLDTKKPVAKRVKFDNSIKSLKIDARVTEKEYMQIMEKSNQAHMSMGRFVISCALDKDIFIFEGFKEFAFQLSKVGSNLNQLSMLANQGRITDPGIGDVKILIKEIWDSMSNLTEKKK